MDETGASPGQAAPKRRQRLHSLVSYKRLGEGRFTWPQVSDGVLRLSRVEFEALFDGLNWKRVGERIVVAPTAAN